MSDVSFAAHLTMNPTRIFASSRMGKGGYNNNKKRKEIHTIVI